MIKITEKNFDLIELLNVVNKTKNETVEKHLILNRVITEEDFNDIYNCGVKFIDPYTDKAINDFETLKIVLG